MIKAKKILVKADVVIARKTVGCVKMKREDVSSITLKKVISLVDEIGLIISGNRNVFVTDAIPGFNELALWFDFATIFGEDWYARADAGEHLHFDF